MGLKAHNALRLYRTSPEVTPSPEIDARVLAAARATPAPHRRGLFVAGAVTAAAVAMFASRIATTPTQDFTRTANGLDEGLARAWLIDLDLQQPTGPGSQEGLP